MEKVRFKQAGGDSDSDEDETMDQIDKYQTDMEGRVGGGATLANKAVHHYNKHDKKSSLKLSAKVAPLVAALNEQAGYHN